MPDATATPGTVHLTNGKAIEIASIDELLPQLEPLVPGNTGYVQTLRRLREVEDLLAKLDKDQKITVTLAGGGEMHFTLGQVLAYEHEPLSA
jgi:hypothetical protein